VLFQQKTIVSGLGVAVLRAVKSAVCPCKPTPSLSRLPCLCKWCLSILFCGQPSVAGFSDERVYLCAEIAALSDHFLGKGSQPGCHNIAVIQVFLVGGGSECFQFLSLVHDVDDFIVLGQYPIPIAQHFE
jgi:hypothetical protein